MLPIALLPLPGVAQAQAAEPTPDTVAVTNGEQLHAAVQAAKPGTRIAIAPGDYRGGFAFTGLRGAAGSPIVLAAADPTSPPRFVGGSTGLHLVDPRFVELHDLAFTGAAGNGVNVDDGGRSDAAPRGLVLRGLRISDVGPRGNCDAIKLSGLTGFRVENCTLERWGIGGGSGIDLVGCRDGVLAGNTLRHAADARATGGNGIQAKGGSSRLVLRGNRFEHAGSRAVNLGGSTGLEFFRPPLAQWPGDERWEAADLLVEGNVFVGSDAPIAFVGVDGATVRFNTLVDPGRWTLRILQEARAPGFVPCRRGQFTDNVVVFRAAAWASGGVNVGPGTAPETFTFARNAWYCRDDPDRSRPSLPRPEQDGLYGVDPCLDAGLRVGAQSRVRGRGADAAPDPARAR
ncbi:MAG: right-handed parallel beta-helix repeat-containing protein [Planctomycetota bacterium]